MAVFLSYRESLRYWRSSAPYFGRELMNSPVDAAPVKACTARLGDVEGLRLEEYSDENGRLELLVFDQAQRFRSSTISKRFIGKKLPERSFYQVKRGVYACSPELLLVLCAAAGSVIDTISLGLELCGTYSLAADGSLFEHDAITTVDDIARYLEEVPGLKGVKTCRRALRYIRNGSASPRETDLYMMLCLPPGLGGFGLGGALLNHTLPIAERLRGKTGMSAITPDLYWKRGSLALEYESDEHHIDIPVITPQMRARHTMDSIRRRTYEALQLKVITVTNGEFISYVEMERIARMVAKVTGRHGIRTDREILMRRTQLHNWLLVPTGNRKPFEER